MAPGLQSIALFSEIVVDHAEGCTITDVDGNQYLDFIAGIAVGSVGHSHPHYVKRIKEQLERATFGSFTTETRARFLNLVASLLPDGTDASAIVFRRRGGGRGGLPACQVGDQEVRVHRLLGRVPWQEPGRDRHAGRRLPQSPGAVSAGHASFALCGLLPLPVQPSASVVRPGLRRASAQRDQERHPRRACGDHHRADAGHGRQRDSARRFHPRGARDRDGDRRALDRRRNSGRLRPHRQDVGLRPFWPEARHHDDRQGHRRRLSLERRRLVARAHVGDALRRAERFFVELRRQSARRSRWARRGRGDPRRQAGRELGARRRKVCSKP